jgi:hypothetical protein
VDGYYGNCVYPMGITRTSKAIREAWLPEVVGVMREAREALTLEVVSSSPWFVLFLFPGYIF